MRFDATAVRAATMNGTMSSTAIETETSLRITSCNERRQRGRAHLHHRWPERAERADELRTAYRYENGQVMPGPDCKFAPGCQSISTQSLAIFERLGDVQTRVIAVDERMGIVLLRMAWGVRERGGDRLTVWEGFKIYDGQIHAGEAFMRILPVDKRNGGWQ
jgi:hypothetical protein